MDTAVAYALEAIAGRLARQLLADLVTGQKQRVGDTEIRATIAGLTQASALQPDEVDYLAQQTSRRLVEVTAALFLDVRTNLQP